MCIRCARPAPPLDSGELTSWEHDEDGFLICPGCLTGEEHRWMDEEAADTLREAEDARPHDPGEGDA